MFADLRNALTRSSCSVPVPINRRQRQSVEHSHPVDCAYFESLDLVRNLCKSEAHKAVDPYNPQMLARLRSLARDEEFRSSVDARVGHIELLLSDFAQHS